MDKIFFTPEQLRDRILMDIQIRDILWGGRGDEPMWS